MLNGIFYGPIEMFRNWLLFSGYPEISNYTGARTSSEVPTQRRQSASATSLGQSNSNRLGRRSPKKTTSGLTGPPQRSHLGSLSDRRVAFT